MAKVPEQIAPGVYRVDAVKIPYVVSVLLIRDDDGWALVDAGRSSLRIQQALAALGAEPDELKRIYLTHHHAEHASGLPSLGEIGREIEVTRERARQIQNSALRKVRSRAFEAELGSFFLEEPSLSSAS